MTDSEIVSLFLARDKGAVAKLDKQYGGLCFSLADRIIGNSLDAQEIKNDALLAVWNSIPPNKPQLLSAFVSKIVRNLSLKRIREKTARKRGGKELDLALDELCDILPSRDDVVSSLEGKELGALINAFLGELSERERDSFVLRYFYFFSLEETAKRLGVSKASIRSSLYRIRKQLKAKLESEGYL